MDYKMIHDYKDNAICRESFIALARKTFSIDFEKWYEDEFTDFVGGNDKTPKDMIKDIEQEFNVDSKSARSILYVLFNV